MELNGGELGCDGPWSNHDPQICCAPREVPDSRMGKWARERDRGKGLRVLQPVSMIGDCPHSDLHRGGTKAQLRNIGGLNYHTIARICPPVLRLCRDAERTDQAQRVAGGKGGMMGFIPTCYCYHRHSP